MRLNAPKNITNMRKKSARPELEAYASTNNLAKTRVISIKTAMPTHMAINPVIESSFVLELPKTSMLFCLMKELILFFFFRRFSISSEQSPNLFFSA